MNQNKTDNGEQWQDAVAVVTVIAIAVAVACFWLAGMP